MNTHRSTKLNCLAALSLALIAMNLSPLLAGWKSGDALPELDSLKLQDCEVGIQGKITLVDFWASWCAPCKSSFPEMETLYSDYKDQGFQILAINLDDDLKAKDRFLSRMKSSFDVALDSEKSAVQSAGIDVIPSCFLIDQNGVIRLVHQGWHGAKSREELAFHIEELLKEAKE